MGQDHEKRGAPVRRGRDFDDDDDDEATFIDMSAPDLKTKDAGAASDGDVLSSDGPTSAKPRRLPPSVADDDDDDDRTEMMERPRLDFLDARPPPAVLPIGADSARLVGGPVHARRALGHDDDDDEPDTAQLTRPPSALPPTTDFTQPRVRPMVSLAGFDEPSEPSNEKTLTRPRVVRMTFRPESAPPLASASPASPPLPAPRPLPPPAGVPRAQSRPAAPRPQATSLQEEPCGRIVVEVPPEAVVFVDGVERGRGGCVLEGVGVFAKVNLRVHRAGCRAWVRTLCLQGEVSLTVRPDVEPR
jgi:hypothetical protein